MKKMITPFMFIVLAFNTALISSGSAEIINAVSCSQADIQAAINSASTGDTISVPSGICSWAASLKIPDAKKLTIKGAGIDVTTVQNSGGTKYTFSVGRSGSRITGFTFQDMWVLMNGTGFRIDHNKFYSTQAGFTGVDSDQTSGAYYEIPTGVIDNNQFYNGRVIVFGGGMMANTEWTLPTGLGTGDNAVFIEDNVFTRSVSPTGNAIDANYGGAYVFRYNTVNGNYLEAHSVQDNNRAAKRWEIYGNTVNKVTGIDTFYGAHIRGGTGLIFGNKFAGNWATRYIGFDNIRSYSNVGAGGLCNGSSLWDGNEDSKGYPCRDQIGMGPDGVLWVASPPGVYAQAHVSAYLWLNRHDSGNITADVINNSGNHIKLGRDYYEYSALFDGTSGIGCGALANRPATCTVGVAYWATNQSCSVLTGMAGAKPSTPIAGTLYKCTATNAWTSYYTPYTYPHPLSRPAPPLGLKIAN